MSTRRKAAPDRPPLTDEQLAQLTADEFVKMKLTDDEKSRLRVINERRWQETERKAVEWRKAEQPLAMELKAAGYDVESVWGLFNRKEPWNKKERITPYPKALPILLKHLERTYPDRVREGIARALAVGREGWSAAGIDMGDAWQTLTSVYRKEKSGTDAKHGLAVAISALADDELLDEVIALAKDDRHGESRLLLLGALERSPTAQARAALMELGTDPELGKEVKAIFRRAKHHK